MGILGSVEGCTSKAVWKVIATFTHLLDNGHDHASELLFFQRSIVFELRNFFERLDVFPQPYRVLPKGLHRG